MARSFYHEHPETLVLEIGILEALPGRVRLARSPFYPGGGQRLLAPPPTPDGKIRIVEIVGLDRQACGGTHLAATSASRPLRILKIENKGRHNRRVRIGLVGLVVGLS